MSILVALQHVTHYKYDRQVALGPQIVRLRPAPHCRTAVPSYSLKVTPANHFVNWQQDPHGNWLARLVFPEKTTEFSVEVDLTAELAVINPFDFFVEPYAEEFPFAYDAELAAELAAYLDVEPAGAAAREHSSRDLPREATRTIDFLVGAQRRAAAEDRLRHPHGARRAGRPTRRWRWAPAPAATSAWLLVQIAAPARPRRALRLRLSDPAQGRRRSARRADRAPDHDFTDLHAWAEVYIPGAGWIGLDATSGLFCGEGHLPLCADAALPLRRADLRRRRAGAGEFDFEMKVERAARGAARHRCRSPTKPGRALDALGEQVDRDLAAQDVRLTMGGEPTFVSIDDFDAPEWNTAAVGPTKRALADDLIRRLRERFAPGGFLHFGQGKWYPGESLPRWAFSLYWRKDGEPIWRDPALIARRQARDGLRPTTEPARHAEGVAKSPSAGAARHRRRLRHAGL